MITRHIVFISLRSSWCNLVFCRLVAGGNDETSRMVWLLTRGQRSWLAPEDLVPLVQDVVDTHPGLSFLKEANEFHSRYVHTVSIVYVQFNKNELNHRIYQLNNLNWFFSFLVLIINCRKNTK